MEIYKLDFISQEDFEKLFRNDSKIYTALDCKIEDMVEIINDTEI
ncbi:hypothetical protein [Mesomycoplasma ovipneumoniae]|nr:hypothetical protein [Mesomycoplasma ovipneumoniae]